MQQHINTSYTKEQFISTVFSSFCIDNKWIIQSKQWGTKWFCFLVAFLKNKIPLHLLLWRTLCFGERRFSLPMCKSPWGYKSPRFIPPLFFHLSASLLFLLPLPPASSLLFFCGGGVDDLWLWREYFKRSAGQDSSSELHRDLPNSPASRLAWASLLSLLTSRLSLRLSGHVFLLPVRLHASCFVLLLPWTVWLSSPLSPVGSDECCRSDGGRGPAFESTVDIFIASISLIFNVIWSWSLVNNLFKEAVESWTNFSCLY